MAYQIYYPSVGSAEPTEKQHGLGQYSVTGVGLFGEPEYRQALAAYEKEYGTYAGIREELMPRIRGILDYYRAGGGYGAGRRTEALEAVRGGLASDIGTQIATGGTSRWTGGLGTRAGSELSKLYKNIEDTRAQLEMQAVAPYMQVLQAVRDIITARPSYGQEVRPVTTTKQAYAYF